MRAIIGARTSDSFWHPLWDRHYRPHFDHVEIIQLGKSYAIPFSTVTIQINTAVEKLISNFDMVVCVDTDEILVPDPEKYKDLSDYMDRCKGAVIRSIGYDIMEMPYQKPVDINDKITDSRTMWTRNVWYDKPVIMRKKIMYVPGQHFCNKKTVPDKDLRLFHFRYADMKSLLMRRNSVDMKAYNDEVKLAEPIPDKWRVI